MFIHEGSNDWREQLAGRYTITDAHLAHSVSVLTEARHRCTARGIDFQVVVVPEKDLVYDRLSPNTEGGISHDRTVCRLIACLPFPVIYPLHALREQAARTPVYHALDSHFNFYGGFVIANAVMDALGQPVFTPEAVPTFHTEWQDDLSIRWGAFKVRRRLIAVPLSETGLNQRPSYHGLHFRYHNPELGNGRTAMIFGDSYAWNPDSGLVRFLALRFETVYFLWQKTIDWTQVDDIRPELILMESGERFLIRDIT